MKRLFLAAALLASFSAWAQTSSNGGAPVTGAANPPGMSSNPTGNTGFANPLPAPVTGSTGAAPLGSGGASVGQTIQGTPLPATPSPNEPSTLGGTTLQPGVLGSAPPSQGVIGSPPAPCIGTPGQPNCTPMR